MYVEFKGLIGGSFGWEMMNSRILEIFIDLLGEGGGWKGSNKQKKVELKQ